MTNHNSRLRKLEAAANAQEQEVIVFRYDDYAARGLSVDEAFAERRADLPDSAILVAIVRQSPAPTNERIS